VDASRNRNGYICLAMPGDGSLLVRHRNVNSVLGSNGSERLMPGRGTIDKVTVLPEAIVNK